MTIGRFLESFDGNSITVGPVSTVEPEKIKAAAFEAGYSSGWEDAKDAERNGTQRIEAEFERNIQSLTFTYHEAVDRVRGELSRFLEELVDVLIPALVPELVREHLRAELLNIADPLLEPPVEIVVSPDCRDWVETMLGDDFSLDIAVVEDHELVAHQVYLRTGNCETEVNMAPLISKLKSQLSALCAGNADENVEPKEEVAAVG